MTQRDAAVPHVEEMATRTPRVALSVYDLPAPDVVEVGHLAEELGFSGLWLGEHLALARGYASEHPTQPGATATHATKAIVDVDTELVDPLVTLGGLATTTSRLELATGVFVLPLRHPLLAARAALTLQDMSGGRLLLGVGVGWLREEFDLVGVPFTERGRRTDETIEVMRLAAAGGFFSYDGAIFRFDDVQLSLRPIPLTIVTGGNTPPAVRRAARHADAWFASGNPDLELACRLRDEVVAARAAVAPERPLRCIVRIAGEGDAGLLERYAAEGFEDVVVWAHELAPDRTRRAEQLAEAAARLGLRG